MTSTRVLFVNSGILGHQAVAELLREAAAHDPAIDSRHVSLAGPLSVGARIVRRLMCLRPFGRTGVGRTNVDLARWRHELHAGLLAARRIRAVEHQWPFDVLHFHTQATAYGSLRRLRHTPAIVSIDVTQPLASLEVASAVGRLSYKPNIWHDGAVFRRAAAVTATSKWAADDLCRHYPDCAPKLHVMPYPVRLEVCDATWPAERHRRATSVDAGPVRLLFMGGDFPRKGGPELLEAWQRAGIAGPAELTLVTDWPLRPADLPRGVQVRRGVTPYSPAWIDLWRQTDLFVMPTKGEAFGMVFQEAAAAGVPAIGTRINAVPEIVGHEVTGLLLPPGDEGALVDAIRQLVGSPERRRDLGEAARRRIEVVGDPVRYAGELSALIRRVAHERRTACAGRF